MRAVNEARVEPDIAVEEEEAGRPGKVATDPRELVAGTMHVQFLPTDEPFGMGQDDGTNRETFETIMDWKIWTPNFEFIDRHCMMESYEKNIILG